MSNPHYNIVHARWTLIDNGREGGTVGYPTLVCELDDGRQLRVGTEQRLLYNGQDAVFVGSKFVGEVSVWVPPDPDESRFEGFTATGFTEQADIVALTKDFLRAVSSGTFEPKVIM